MVVVTRGLSRTPFRDVIGRMCNAGPVRVLRGGSSLMQPAERTIWTVRGLHSSTFVGQVTAAGVTRHKAPSRCIRSEARYSTSTGVTGDDVAVRQPTPVSGESKVP